MNSRKIIFCFAVVLISLLFILGCQKKVPANELDRNLASVSNDNADTADAGKENQKVDFVFISNPERVEHNTFSIVKKGDWKETEYNGGLIYMPQDGEFANPFSEKFAMTVVFLPENETRALMQLTELDIAKSRELLPDLQVIEKKEGVGVSLGQIDAVKIIFTASVQNKTLQITQLRAIQGNRFYAFTQQCEYEKCRYTNIFKEMAQSFQWKNP